MSPRINQSIQPSEAMKDSISFDNLELFVPYKVRRFEMRYIAELGNRLCAIIDQGSLILPPSFNYLLTGNAYECFDVTTLYIVIRERQGRYLTVSFEQGPPPPPDNTQ